MNTSLEDMIKIIRDKTDHGNICRPENIGIGKIGILVKRKCIQNGWNSVFEEYSIE